MKKVSERKYNALKSIVSAYECFRGGEHGALMTQLEKIKNKISQEEYNRIKILADNYKDYVCQILAYTRKVFVKLDDENLERIFDDLD